MKKTLIIAGLLVAAASLCSGSVTMVFQGFQPAGWQAGYPYYLTANGTPLNVMCDDWEHGGEPGDVWQANFTSLGSGNLSLLRWNQMPNALTLYQEAGWLLLETRNTPPVQWMDINYAVWSIFDSSVVLSPNQQYWLTSAQNEALLGFPGIDFNEVGIYTPVNQYDPNMNDPQEFLTTTPEPASLTLVCAGGIALFARRKKLLS